MRRLAEGMIVLTSALQVAQTHNSNHTAEEAGCHSGRQGKVLFSPYHLARTAHVPEALAQGLQMFQKLLQRCFRDHAEGARMLGQPAGATTALRLWKTLHPCVRAMYKRTPARSRMHARA